MELMGLIRFGGVLPKAGARTAHSSGGDTAEFASHGLEGQA